MGSFDSFLYINDFFGDESLFGCPPFVVFYCVAVCMWVALSIYGCPSCRSVLRAPGLRFRSSGGGCAQETAGRHVWPCFGFQLHTTEGGQAKRDNFLAILHILDARGHNSTKAT